MLQTGLRGLSVTATFTKRHLVFLCECNIIRNDTDASGEIVMIFQKTQLISLFTWTIVNCDILRHLIKCHSYSGVAVVDRFRLFWITRENPQAGYGRIEMVSELININKRVNSKITWMPLQKFFSIHKVTCLCSSASLSIQQILSPYILCDDITLNFIGFLIYVKILSNPVITT